MPEPCENAPRRPLPGRRWLPASVAVVVGITFLPAVRNGFVDFGDLANFVLNPAYRGLGWAQLSWMFTSAHMGDYIPLTWMTLGLDYVLWGLRPAGYHLTSVVLHVATAVLFFHIARRIIGAWSEPAEGGAAAVGALFAAVFFGLHPLRVESVAWVAERRDVLCGAFFMLTVLCWLRALEPAPRSRAWYSFSLLSFGCALLSNPIVVALPGVLLVLDVFPLRRLGGETGWLSARARTVYVEKLAFVVLSAVASLVVVRVAVTAVDRADITSRGELQARLAVAAYGLAFYVWKTIVPVALSPLYELSLPVDPTLDPYAVAAGVILAFSALAVVLRRRAPWLLAAWITYVLLLLPVLGLVQAGAQAPADRYTYLGCLPWAIAVGGVGSLAYRRAIRAGQAGVLGLATVGMGILLTLQVVTVSQVTVWRDSLNLWRHAVAVDPSSVRAHNNLGSALLQAGRSGEAIDELRTAVSLTAASPPALRAQVTFALATGLQLHGDLAGAEAFYRESLSLERRQSAAWNNLGVILAMRGNLDAALAAFKASLDVAPGDPDACRNGRRAAAALGKKLAALERCRAERKA